MTTVTSYQVVRQTQQQRQLEQEQHEEEEETFQQADGEQYYENNS